MRNQIHIPLDLPDVRILEVNQLSPQGWLIRVESTIEGSTCAKCGRDINAFHGYDAPLRLRHLPLFEVPVWIEIRPKRYRCPHCEGGRRTPSPRPGISVEVRIRKPMSNGCCASW